MDKGSGKEGENEMIGESGMEAYTYGKQIANGNLLTKGVHTGAL